MARFLIRKGLLYLAAMFSIVSLNFGLIHLMPGDALVHLIGEEGFASLGGQGPEAFARLRHAYGLAAGPAEQYRRYVLKSISGDWGWSYHYGRPVARVVGQRLCWSLMLLAPAIVLSVAIGGGIALSWGWDRRRRRRRLLTTLFLCGYSVPGYCLGLLLLVAAAKTDLLPLGGMMDRAAGPGAALAHLLLPLTVLVVHGAAHKFAVMQGAIAHEIDRPYVLTAFSKGLTARRVLWGHVLRNALPPFVAAVALDIGFVMGGALLVEVVFDWQGMGTLIYQAVLTRDYPMLAGSLTALAGSMLAANMAADVCCGALDPRIREGSPLGQG